MNFKDAAIKILEEQKKALHYKKIATLAIKNKLLEHPGSNPAKRMLEVLKLEGKKKSIVLTVKPGFFILKKYSFKKNDKNKLKEKKSLNPEWLDDDTKKSFDRIMELEGVEDSKKILKDSFTEIMELEGVKPTSKTSKKETKKENIKNKKIPKIKEILKEEKNVVNDSTIAKIVEDDFTEFIKDKEIEKSSFSDMMELEGVKPKGKKLLKKNNKENKKNIKNKKESLLDKKIKKNEKKFKVKMLHNLAAESTMDLKELISLIKKMDLEQFSFSIKELKSSTLINEEEQKIIKTEIENFQKTISNLQKIKIASIEKEEKIQKNDIEIKKDMEIDIEKEISNISYFSKQIYSKNYFSEEKKKKELNKENIKIESDKKESLTEIKKDNSINEEKENSINEKIENKKDNQTSSKKNNSKDKFNIPKELLKKLIDKKEIRYYSILELKKIVENMGFNPIKESELSTLLYKFNKDKRNNYPFYLFNGRLLPTKLIQSDNFTESNSSFNKLLQERNILVQKELSNWIKRLSFNGFLKIVKIILEKNNLGSLTAIKGFNQHYYVTQSIGLSKMKFVLQIKKENKPITKYDIIEMRGMMPRFKVSNSILITSSFFKDSAIEESTIDTHSTIVLIDKAFIVKKMIELKIGLFQKKSGLIVVDHNFFLTLTE